MSVFGRIQGGPAYFQQCVELLVLERFGESGSKGLTSTIQKSVKENIYDRDPGRTACYRSTANSTSQHA
jgi:hypothetical protein